MGEFCRGYTQNQHWRRFGPILVEVDQGRIDLLVSRVAFDAHEIAPWLLIEGGRSPPRSLEDFLQISCGNGFIREGAGTPAMKNDGQDAFDVGSLFMLIQFCGRERHR